MKVLHPLIQILPFFHGQPAATVAAVANLLHDAYPGDDHWIEPLRPDLLGEHLAQTIGDESPDGAAIMQRVFGEGKMMG